MGTAARLAKLAALCCAAALAAGCDGGPADGGPVRITADFQNVAGLYAGNEVDVLGVPVGRIDRIEPKGGFVEVAMTLDPGTRIPADAVAALVNPQLITNRHVELYPAWSGSGPTAADGDHIPLARTRTPVELDRILETFDQLGSALRGDNRTGPMASRVLFPLLDGNGDRLRDTLDQLSAAFETTLANKDQISDTVVRLGEITDLLARNDRTVRDFSGRMTDLANLLAQQAPGLQAVLAQLDAFTTDTAALLGQNRDQLAGSVQRFVAISDRMRANARNLTEITDVTPLMFENVANAVSPERQALRLHALADKSALDGEALSTFCERLLLRLDGCRTGKLADMGPDFGLTAALLGLTGNR